MKSQFRSTSPQDSPAVAAFLQRIFAVDPGLPFIEPRQLQWKCWDERSDWPGSRGYVMDKDDAIVAHGAVVPLTCVNGERRLKMVHLIDWASDPKTVGGGAILLKKIAHMVDAVVVAGGTAMTLSVLPSLGFKPWCKLTRFALPLRPFRRVAGQSLGVRSAAQFARSCLWSLKTPSVPTRRWTTNPISSEQLQSQSIAWPRSQGQVAVFERSPEMLDYFLKCPSMPIKLYAVARDGENRGYFVLALAPGQARIADFYVNSEDAQDWRVLVRLAVLQAGLHPDAAEVVAYASDAVTHQALLGCGFHARTTSTLQILAAKDVEIPAGQVRFQMLDTDAAYLHENKSSFWA